MKKLVMGLFALGLAFLIYANIRGLQSYLGVFDRMSDSFTVRQEMKRIADQVYRDYITDETLPSGSFANYIRNNFKRNKNIKRDPAIDRWGNGYILLLNADGTGFNVRSAGPDGEWRTEDDIIVERETERPIPAATIQEAVAGMPAAPAAPPGGDFRAQAREGGFREAVRDGGEKDSEKKRSFYGFEF